MPTHRNKITQLDASFKQAIKAQSDTEAFDLVAEFIAMQLLASCYTLLPATRDDLPFSQQRMGSRAITA